MTASASEAAFRRSVEMLYGQKLANFAPYFDVTPEEFTGQTPSCEIGKLKYEKASGMGSSSYWLTVDGMVRLIVNDYSGEIEMSGFVNSEQNT